KSIPHDDYVSTVRKILAAARLNPHLIHDARIRLPVPIIRVEILRLKNRVLRNARGRKVGPVKFPSKGVLEPLNILRSYLKNIRLAFNVLFPKIRNEDVKGSDALNLNVTLN